MSVDRQKLDLSKYINLLYRKFFICRDTAWFYEHENDALRGGGGQNSLFMHVPL